MNTFAVYSRMPVWVQNLLCSTQGYRLDHQRYGGEYEAIFRSLLESEKWDKEQILRYKEENIARILRYAYEHTRFYRRFFDGNGVNPDDFKHLADLQKFPVLTKEMVRENWRDMISDEFSTGQLIPYHTSGSTGKALDFFWTYHSLRFYWATVWRGRARFGVNRGDLHLNFTGKTVVPLTQQQPPYWRYNKALNQYMVNMQHLTRGKISVFVDFVNRKKARFFVGYPSIIHSFAMLVEEAGLKITAPPEFIFSSAEKMYDFQREVIERVCPGVKIVEHYGFSENAACASKDLDGVYHEDFELGHLELIDPVTSERGQTGVMLATGFQNLGMPFIRYEIGDTATFVASGKIVDIEGRNEDYIITPEGTRIMRMDYIFKAAKGIKECQIVQNEVGRIIIRIVRRDGYDAIETEKTLRREIHCNISPALQADFEYVEAIPRTKAGKFKAVISKL